MKRLISGIFITVMLFGTSVVEGQELIGQHEISGIFMKDKLGVYAFDDPEISGVTCYVTPISKALSLTDPSNTSIACRQTGTITLSSRVASNAGVEVFRQAKSLVFKKLKVRRWYDAKRKVLIYVAHTEKMINDSYKNSISVVVVK